MVEIKNYVNVPKIEYREVEKIMEREIPIIQYVDEHIEVEKIVEIPII